MDKFSERKAAAMAATPGPWEWFTSNSMARLSSIPSGKDGDVLSAFRASDGVPCVSVSQPDMAFIAAANPAVVLALLDRIAELEAKTEMTMGVGSGNGNLFVHGDYDSIKAAQAIVLENESLRAKLATLVRFKVGTDSVDSDVSDRNQPGMVVAVHVDAGDFVKVKGQVYEVKEACFDDHDVTLWFVCGEVLKCAAGCQIEVVSAPEGDA